MKPPTAAGLYVHVPFCSSICPYCDFAVRKGNAALRRSFVDSLHREIELLSEDRWTFDSIYFGGGTPSSLEPEGIRRILQAAYRTFEVGAGCSISMEVNPEDVDEDSAARWRELNVGTISLGIQSFRDSELSYLGRKHDAATARRSVEIVRAAGFRVSVDIIFGLPEQTMSDLEESLGEAIRLKPDHVSCYQLTVHGGTAFGSRRDRGQLREMPEEDQAWHYEMLVSRLASAGYEAYEVSNFARSPEHRSLHNQKYWSGVDYLGLGPSAHSLRGNERWWNLRTLTAYQAAISKNERPIECRESLSHRDIALEDLMLRLRTSAGIDLAEYRTEHGIDLLVNNRDLIDSYREHGLLTIEKNLLRPTRAGLAVADRIATELEI